MKHNKTETILQAIRIIDTGKFKYRRNRDDSSKSMLVTSNDRSGVVIDDELFWALFGLYYDSSEFFTKEGVNMNC